MDKNYSYSLSGIIKKINRNIQASFLILFIVFIVTIGIAFVTYKSSEEKVVSQKLEAAFSSFVAKTSQKLIAITMREEFREYIHSGWLSRERSYNSFLTKLFKYSAKLDVVTGMDIIDKYESVIFSYGIKTEDSVTLELCYLNRRFLNFDVGNCLYKWRIYFNKDIVIKELRKSNPELVPCSNCAKNIIKGDFFWRFSYAFCF